MRPPGLSLWVQTEGLPQETAPETFVLLHGFGGSSFSWRTWIPYLAARGHVVVVDLKGFGRAGKPDDGRYAPADQASQVLELIRRRDLSDVTLVGHSYGGGVALLTALALGAIDGPTPLRRLVVMAGAAYRQRLPPFVTLARHPKLSNAAMRLLGPRLVVSQAIRTIVYDTASITRDQIDGYAEPLGTLSSTRAILQVAAQIVPDDLDSLARRYPEIRVPTLLLWGRQDRVVPLWVGRRLAAAIPNSTLHVIERCGHLPAEERTTASLAALDEFLGAG